MAPATAFLPITLPYSATKLAGEVPRGWGQVPLIADWLALIVQISEHHFDCCMQISDNQGLC